MDMHAADTAEGVPFSFTCDGTPFYRSTSQMSMDFARGSHLVTGVILLLWSLQSTSSQCATSTPRMDHFFVEHINNWQNACVLLAFLASGIVDLASLAIELPEGLDKLPGWIAIHTQLLALSGHASVQHVRSWRNGMRPHTRADPARTCRTHVTAGRPQVFLTLAFALSALMLGTSQEAGESFRQGVYHLLYLATAACAALTAGEALFPSAFLLSCGRALALAMQGVSYLLVSRVLFEGRAAWQSEDPADMAPSMFVPVLFIMWLQLTSLIMFGVFVAVRWLHEAPEDVEEEAGGMTAEHYLSTQ
ncbi:MAG: hypothetical protein WDW38_003104 [Sanguina aurantia]